jgi:hypothetical protein
VQDKDFKQRGIERQTKNPILHAIDLLQSSLDQRHMESVKRIEAGAADMREFKEQLQRILAGFPEADPEAHCRYHKEVMAELEERKKLWREIRAHILKGGTWAVVIGVCWGVLKLFQFYLEKKL